MDQVPTISKQCTRCGETKPRTEYHLKRGHGDGVHSRCKPCRNALAAERKPLYEKTKKAYREKNRDALRAYVKQWRAEHPDYNRKRYWQNPEKFKAKQRMLNYGITGAQYAALVEAQGGLCAICRGPPRNKGLHVDHCHATGAIRGLLCPPCNLSLGSMRDSPALLRSAASYLEERVNGMLPKADE